ncbi:hypothetical protein PspLS_05313 [Pyricularia sp. CBS 133598]|nr:hypothetical protein PspLS_05313 [Pyricularia sp. CBS 133598]
MTRVQELLFSVAHFDPQFGVCGVREPVVIPVSLSATVETFVPSNARSSYIVVGSLPAGHFSIAPKNTTDYTGWRKTKAPRISQHFHAIPDHSIVHSRELTCLMASSEVDQKFLGKFANTVEPENPLLASMLFKILGLSISLSQQLVKARKQRRLETSRGTSTPSLDLYFHIIWLSNQGLVMLEQYVLPLVGHYVELKVLAYKLRASFYHIFVLFHNQPPVSTMSAASPEIKSLTNEQHRLDKGKGPASNDYGFDVGERTSGQSNHQIEGGPVGGTVRPPPGFAPEAPASFLLPAGNFLPVAHTYFKQAVSMAEELLWGSHSLRLSVKTEYAAFLYECMHDGPGSRKLAKDTITEVYEASEGIDNDMFNDACELVTVLGRMMKRGLSASKDALPSPNEESNKVPDGAFSSHKQQASQDSETSGKASSFTMPAPLRVASASKPPPMPPSTTAASIPPQNAGIPPGFI